MMILILRMLRKRVIMMKVIVVCFGFVFVVWVKLVFCLLRNLVLD